MKPAEADTKVQLISGVISRLGIDGIAVLFVWTVGEVVAGEQVPGNVRKGREARDLLRNRADARRGNNVAGEGGPSRATSRAGRRIVNSGWVGGLVSRFYGGCRDSVVTRSILPRQVAVVAGEIEKLILLDRAANGSAKIVQDGLGVGRCDRQKEGSRDHAIVEVVFERGPVHLVGAALNLDVHRGPAREALRGIVTVGIHVHHLDRLKTGNVCR